MSNFVYDNGIVLHNGIPFGRIQKTGYVQGYKNNKTIYLHRLVWELHNGEIPKGMMIDHINCNRSDNRIENLRLVTNAQNLQNVKKARSDSKIGVAGVQAKGNKWRARITINGKVIRLGHYDTIEEAHQVYINAKLKYHTHFNLEAA